MKIKLNKSVILLLLAGMFAAPKAYSQDAGQGCANIKIKQLINKDTVEFTDAQIKSGIQLTCDTSARKLLPVGFAPGYPDPTKDYYTYESIPYDPPTTFTAGERIYLPQDDCWSQLFSLDYFNNTQPGSGIPPFMFRFYENTYDHVMANSNGAVTFYDEDAPIYDYAVQKNVNLFLKPTTSSNLWCPYDYSKELPDPRKLWSETGNIIYTSPVLNAICGPFQDIHYGKIENDLTKGMFINFIGEYPCRTCIISMNQIPNYGNNGSSDTNFTTSMIVMYETTNVIEFYIEHKAAYTSTNSSNAILGIQNLTGTKSTTIENKKYKPEGAATMTTQSYNNTKWKADKEAWRIKPVGELDHSYTWYKKATLGDKAGELQGPLAADGNDVLTAQPSFEEGPTWFFCSMDVKRLEDGEVFSVLDSILIIPMQVPTVTISHNSATNLINQQGNSDSTAYIDTICAGEQLRFRFTGGDEYFVVEPEMFAGSPINNSTLLVSQPSDVPFVKYKFQINNYEDGELLCTRYDSCVIYNRAYEVNIGNDTSICKGADIQYENLLYDADDPQTEAMEYKYSWKYGSQEISDELAVEDYVPQSTGTLTLNVADRLGCTAKSSAKVTVYDYPKVSIEGSRDVCKGSSTVLTAKVDKPNALQYAWNDNLSTTEASVKVSPAETQAYTVTVTYSDAKCVTKESATVNVVHYPQIACMDDQRMCEGDLATIAVSGQAEGYQWSSSDVSIDGNTGTQYEVSPDASTEYKVTAYNNDTLRCESTDAMMVYVMRKPTVIINYNPSVIDELTPQVVFADSTTGVTERLWRLGDGTESSDKQFLHTFDLDDTTRAYSVTLIGTTVDGCVDSANTEIAVQRDHHVWSPNAVYLHDNNVANRTFRVHIDQIQEFKLLVFNRWGEVVFESDDMEQAWDCTHKGKVVPQGVYTWVVQYRQTDSPKREKKTTGTVFIYN